MMRQTGGLAVGDLDQVEPFCFAMARACKAA
jgi:hypothetical protein